MSMCTHTYTSIDWWWMHRVGRSVGRSVPNKTEDAHASLTTIVVVSHTRLHRPGKERSLHLVCTLKGAGRFFQEFADAIRRRAQVRDMSLVHLHIYTSRFDHNRHA